MPTSTPRCALRDAIVAAVRRGELPEDAPADAAERVRRLAAWTLGQTARHPRGGRATARRRASAVRAGSPPPARRQGHRRRRAPRGLPLIARGARGRVRAAAQHRHRRRDAVGRRRAARRAAARHHLGRGCAPTTWPACPDPALPVLPAAAAARWCWWSATRTATRGWPRRWTATLEVRPDAVVVEMGVPVAITGGVHLATYGATRACGQAAAELIAGSESRHPRRGRWPPDAAPLVITQTPPAATRPLTSGWSCSRSIMSS